MSQSENYCSEAEVLELMMELEKSIEDREELIKQNLELKSQLEEQEKKTSDTQNRLQKLEETKAQNEQTRQYLLREREKLDKQIAYYEADRKRDWNSMQIEARAELNNESAKLHAKYFFSLYGSILVLFITYLILGLVSETFRFDVCEAAIGVYTVIALWFDSTWNVVSNAVFLFLDGKGAIFLMWLLRIVCGILITIAIGVGLFLLGRKIFLLLKETPNWYHGYEKINLWDKWFTILVVTTFCLCVVLSNLVEIMINWILVWVLLIVLLQGARYLIRKMKYS